MPRYLWERVMDVKLVVLGGKHPGLEIAVPGAGFLSAVRLRPSCVPTATWSAGGTA